MINLLVDLDIEHPELVQKRSIKVGEVFPIVLYAQHGATDHEDVSFDTLILEVFFNDSEEAIVRVDPTDRPVAGSIVRTFKKTKDAFRAEEVSSPETLRLSTATQATPLALFGFASSEPTGPFSGRSGRAGIQNLEHPFRLKIGDKPVSVMVGKATAGLRANKAGQTRIIANGIAFLKGETVPIKSVASVLSVTP